MSRPPISYYGSKARIAPWLVENFPTHRLFGEPFCGSARTLFWHARSPAEVISDIDRNLINFLTQLRDNWRLLQAVCRHDYDRDFFTEAHRTFRHVGDPIEAARRYFTVNRQSFGGLPRTSTWDAKKANAFRSALAQFPAAAARLSGVEISCMHYRTAMLLHDAPDAFFYCDPPYFYGTGRRRNSYWHEMGEAEEHLRFLRFIKSLKGRVMVSGYASKLYAEELRAWNPKRKRTRSTYANQQYKPERIERIWMNY